MDKFVFKMLDSKKKKEVQNNIKSSDINIKPPFNSLLLYRYFDGNVIIIK